MTQGLAHNDLGNNKNYLCVLLMFSSRTYDSVIIDFLNFTRPTCFNTVSDLFSSYANKGSYEKAITDFEVALKENPTHANAVNYASETLVAYAKQ